MNFEARVAIIEKEIRENNELLFFSRNYGLNDSDVTREIKKKIAVLHSKRKRLYSEKIEMMDWLDSK